MTFPSSSTDELLFEDGEVVSPDEESSKKAALWESEIGFSKTEDCIFVSIGGINNKAKVPIEMRLTRKKIR